MKNYRKKWQKLPKAHFDVLLIANGILNDFEQIRNLQAKSDRTYCLDGAYDKCLKHKLRVDKVLGDMDSVRAELTDDLKVPLDNQEKSDLDKSLDWLAEQGVDSVMLTGISGGRSDHELMNFFIAFEHAAQLHLSFIDGTSTGEFLSAGHYRISIQEGEHFSLIPYESPRNLSLSGSKYTLDDVDNISISQGLSNISLKPEISISFVSGKLLFICPDGSSYAS